jgi:hypothetical protein
MSACGSDYGKQNGEELAAEPPSIGWKALLAQE